jgi:hypothetical protein
VRTPAQAIPVTVERWARRARWLRWLDAMTTVVIVWPFVMLTLETPPVAGAIVAAALVGAAALVRPLRLRWRPASGLVGLSASRGLKPGDLAWCILEHRVERVIVTARRRLRLVVARPDQGAAEGLEVRRTRVLVVPAR